MNIFRTFLCGILIVSTSGCGLADLFVGYRGNRKTASMPLGKPNPLYKKNRLYSVQNIRAIRTKDSYLKNEPDVKSIEDKEIFATSVEYYKTNGREKLIKYLNNYEKLEKNQFIPKTRISKDTESFDLDSYDRVFPSYNVTQARKLRKDNIIPLPTEITDNNIMMEKTGCDPNDLVPDDIFSSSDANAIAYNQYGGYRQYHLKSEKASRK